MRDILHKTARSIISSAIVITVLLSVAGCSFIRHSVATLESTDHFIANENDARVLFEPGAEDYADKITEYLPSAIKLVEEKQYSPFSEPIQVFVCASRKNFRKYFGADVRAGVLTKLFLSPRVFDYGDKIGKKYLTHELSHLHLQQKLGLLKMNKLPMWFKEGLATYVSNGGGAHLISERQAIASIKAGKHFVPNKVDGLIFKKTPGDFGLEPHMFYRQSMMFLNYLTTIDALGFREFLLSVESGDRLPDAFQATYKKNLEALWIEFLNK
jgi:hypothetical protein